MAPREDPEDREDGEDPEDREEPPPAAGSRGSRWLAAIPVTVGLLLGALLLPHMSPPEDVPLPRTDTRVLAATERGDDTRAARAEATELPAEVRALGDAVRAFNVAEAKDARETNWPKLRAEVDRTRRIALEKGIDAIVSLRAVQLAIFLREVRRYEQTGEISAELDAVGGAFVRRMSIVGWVDGRRVAFDEHALRAAFKLKWNAVTRFEQVPELALSLDETRALYAFYLTHPLVPDTARLTFAAARKTARTPADCAALAEGERIAREGWRLEKVEQIGKQDPAYPLLFARGVEQYRTGKFDLAASTFTRWLESHPDGPFTLRARNHLRASLAASRPR